jgi:hypothetical protein
MSGPAVLSICAEITAIAGAFGAVVAVVRSAMQGRQLQEHIADPGAHQGGSHDGS